LTSEKIEPIDALWDDVTEIVAYKLDMLSYDVICLGFRLRGSDTFIEVAEECSGYKELLVAVEQQFPLAENWFSKVAFPAFELNWLTLWKAESVG